MKDVIAALPGIALTVLCWGMYGPILHKGQDGLAGNRLKPLICVGLAYLLVAIIVPITILALKNNLSGEWSFTGIAWSLTAGVAGALGAMGIILALTSGGKPVFVMPLVFGCAPVVAVFVSMLFAGTSPRELNPIFIAGLILVSVGAATVLVFQPKSKPHGKPEKPAAEAKADPDLAPASDPKAKLTAKLESDDPPHSDPANNDDPANS